MFYSRYAAEQKRIFQNITNGDLSGYILRNLNSSLNSIGFSKSFTKFVVNNFSSLDFKEFYDNFSAELNKVYDIGFFQKIVPAYFHKEVFPHIPSAERLLDVGCGTGILIHSLSKYSKFKTLVGIDIHRYSKWKKFSSYKSRFLILKESKFDNFLKKYQPDCVVLTWTLHHMSLSEQKRYLKKLKSNVKIGTKIIILEDSYSDKLLPKEGKIICNEFMRWKANERKQIMSVYDWIANRILARRSQVPIPFAYRTLEEWEKLCTEVGFKIVKKVFIGFPKKRDINTPQSLLVIEKNI